MSPAVIVLIVFSILLVIIISSVFLERKFHIDKTDPRTEFNITIIKGIKEKDFHIDKIYYLDDEDVWGDDANVGKQQILIDHNNKKLALISYDKFKVHILKFNVISNYEVYVDEDTVFSGLSAHNLGFGVFSARSKRTCNDFKLIIKTNDYQNPQITYTLLNQKLKKDSYEFRAIMSSVQEFTAFLDIILKENNTKK